MTRSAASPLLMIHNSPNHARPVQLFSVIWPVAKSSRVGGGVRGEQDYSLKSLSKSPLYAHSIRCVCFLLRRRSSEVILPNLNLGSIPASPPYLRARILSCMPGLLRFMPFKISLTSTEVNLFGVSLFEFNRGVVKFVGFDFSMLFDFALSSSVSAFIFSVSALSLSIS